MIVYPNNDAKRPRPTVAPLRRASSRFTEEQNLEHIDPEATPELLQELRERLTNAESAASWYYNRNKLSFDYFSARWDGQTTDGRKWAADAATNTNIWPWPGASDTRVRTTEMIVGERFLVAMFAVMNMKVQAQAARPLASMKESQQATQLLNWQIFTQMSEEVFRELPFLINWQDIYGASILEVIWEQETRLYMQPINLINLQALAKAHGAQASQMLEQFISDLFDPAREENAIALVQSASVDTAGNSFIKKPQARKILTELREMRTAEIPVVEVCVSKPRWTALQLMLDVIFPARTSDIQRAWVNRVEFVSETTLTDRIETAGYDPDFVDQAVEQRGSSNVPHPTSNDWRTQYVGPGGVNPYGGDDDEEADIRLEHFYRRGLFEGVPAVYCTVFNQDVEVAAKHEPLGYEHGELPFTVVRREHHQRPILSSRGVPEIVYTWEQEIKKQCDMRADRTDMALMPPLLTTSYEDLIKLKTQLMPASIVPVRRMDQSKYMEPPRYDPGSVEIEANIMERINRMFPYFNGKNPAHAQQASQMLADQLLMHLKPALRQTGALVDQYIPEETVIAVLGPNSGWKRPSRQEIHGRFHIIATVDMRTLDPDFLKQMLQAGVQLVQLDTMGVIDRTKFIRILAESVSYELAESIMETAPATEKEREDEMAKDDLILASGVDQPMPMGANFQLRLQVLQQKLQSYQQNPVSARRLAENPEIMKVFENRGNFLQRQLQQRENAQIGRMQVSNTFDKNAAAAAAPVGSGQ